MKTQILIKLEDVDTLIRYEYEQGKLDAEEAVELLGELYSGDTFMNEQLLEGLELSSQPS